MEAMVDGKYLESRTMLQFTQQHYFAMQSINITISNPLFMGIFLGTAATRVFLTGASLLKYQHF